MLPIDRIILLYDLFGQIKKTEIDDQGIAWVGFITRGP